MYYIINSVACYMFWPLVAIFREEFSEGYVT